ncbi:MAG: hypothetical protein V3U31_00245 [Dehalococcoidia bacterium]
MNTERRLLDVILHTLLGPCPICGRWTQDRRYKREMARLHCQIRRLRRRSVTMECRDCRLHFTVTFHSLIQALRNKAATNTTRDERIRFEAWAEQVAAMTPPPDTRGRRKGESDEP